MPSTARHGTARGLPLKEVLEYVVPELNTQCLRQASSSPKVPEQLLKLDEQGVSAARVCLPVCVLPSPRGPVCEDHLLQTPGALFQSPQQAFLPVQKPAAAWWLSRLPCWCVPAGRSAPRLQERGCEPEPLRSPCLL